MLPTVAPSTPSQHKRSLKKNTIKKPHLALRVSFFKLYKKCCHEETLQVLWEPYVLSSRWHCHVKPTTSSGLLQANPKTTTRPLFLESKPGFLPPNLPLCPKFLNNETVSHCHPKKTGARDDLQGITSHHRLQGMDVAVLHVSCSQDKAFSPAAGVHDVHGRSHLGRSTRSRKIQKFFQMNSFGRRWRELWKCQCYIKMAESI